LHHARQTEEIAMRTVAECLRMLAFLVVLALVMTNILSIRFANREERGENSEEKIEQAAPN
jgi:hypothetical protein